MTAHRTLPRRSRPRRGSALILVLIMTLSLAGLAISAIYLSSSAGLLTRYYDRERDYRYAAEAALALGKSRVNKDTGLGLPELGALPLGQRSPAHPVLRPRARLSLRGRGGTRARQVARQQGHGPRPARGHRQADRHRRLAHRRGPRAPPPSPLP